MTKVKGEADPATDNPDDTADESDTTPDLLPCPFSGSTDLDDSGDVIVCRTNGVSGPVPEEGETKYDAWNGRVSDDEETDDEETAADEPAPDPDPAATVAGFKSIDAAKKGYATLATKANGIHSQLIASRKSAKAAQKAVQTTRLSLVAAIREKAGAVAKLNTANAEIAKLKAHAKGEPQRINSQVTRTIAASGHPAPVAGEINTNGATGAPPSKPDTSALRGKDRIAAHINSQLFKK